MGAGGGEEGKHILGGRKTIRNSSPILWYRFGPSNWDFLFQSKRLPQQDLVWLLGSLQEALQGCWVRPPWRTGWGAGHRGQPHWPFWEAHRDVRPNDSLPGISFTRHNSLCRLIKMLSKEKAINYTTAPCFVALFWDTISNQVFAGPNTRPRPGCLLSIPHLAKPVSPTPWDSHIPLSLEGAR